MNTTLAAIRSHSPCASGWKKLIAALGDYGDETPLPLARIVETNGIADALWALRTQPTEIAKRIAVTFAVECAARVLPIFEAKRPNDTRPREAIAATRAWLEEPTPENAKKARDAAAAASASAYAADAADAAYAAAYAAERTWQKARLIQLLEG